MPNYRVPPFNSRLEAVVDALLANGGDANAEDLPQLTKIPVGHGDFGTPNDFEDGSLETERTLYDTMMFCLADLCVQVV